MDFSGVMSSRFWLFSTVILLLIFIGYPSNPAAPDTSTLNERLNVDLVDLYLTATNNKGGFVTDLKGNELTVTENGIIQKISAFTNFARDTHEAPLVLTMMIDTSGSMSDDIGNVWKIDLAREAALLLLDELKPQEKAMAVTFDENLNSTELTSDKDKIRSFLQNVRVRFGGTTLYDATLNVIDQLNHSYGRKILLICSDGNDTISKSKLDQVVQELSKSPDIAVVALGTVSRKPARKYSELMTDYIEGKSVLNKLADVSGGYAFFPTTLKEVENVRELMRQFLLSQYSLAYFPGNRNWDGSWRDIKITCSRKDVRLRYRNGYFAR